MSDIVDKVQKLLSKADDPACTEEEAKAFYAKAQQYMVEHAITEQQIRMARPGERSTPEARRFQYSNDWSFLPGKRMMLGAISQLNGCKLIYHTGTKVKPQFATVIGFADDVNFVEMLYTSCLLQSSRHLRGMSGTQKTSFVGGFAVEVFTRLEEAKKMATDEAAPGSALVLANRDADVEELQDDLFPTAKPMKKQQAAKDPAAYWSGRDAGKNADLSGGRNDIGSKREELGA